MRFLIDNALSPVLATLLEQAGHNALHVRSIELHRSDDAVIFDRAAIEDRIVVSADTDFGTLLATRSAQKPETARSSHSNRRACESVRFQSTSRSCQSKSFAGRHPRPPVDDFVVRETSRLRAFHHVPRTGEIGTDSEAAEIRRFRERRESVF